MNILKKTYVIPKTDVEKISVGGVMVFFCSSQPQREDYSDSTRCPFNGLWCIEKQEHLDAWRNAVKSYAQQRKNYLFHTRGDMFDGCPLNRKSLCAAHEQRQRG